MVAAETAARGPFEFLGGAQLGLAGNAARGFQMRGSAMVEFRSTAKIFDKGSDPKYEEGKEENPDDPHPHHHSGRHVGHHEFASQFGDTGKLTFSRSDGSPGRKRLSGLMRAANLAA
jgi:hypothetical protein